jgi:hypothetical protein
MSDILIAVVFKSLNKNENVIILEFQKLPVLQSQKNFAHMHILNQVKKVNFIVAFSFKQVAVVRWLRQRGPSGPGFKPPLRRPFSRNIVLDIVDLSK